MAQQALSEAEAEAKAQAGAQAFGKQHESDILPEKGESIIVLFAPSDKGNRDVISQTGGITITPHSRPVRWIDAESPVGQEALLSLPGVSSKEKEKDKNREEIIIDGKELKYLPAALMVRDGKVTRIMSQGEPIASAAELDTLYVKAMINMPEIKELSTLGNQPQLLSSVSIDPPLRTPSPMNHRYAGRVV